MSAKSDPPGSTEQDEEERPDEDAESVFSDSEEEEGELIGGKRDVASDADDEGDAETHENRERAAGIVKLLMDLASVDGGGGSASRCLSASSR